jgi:hypothetical protein
MMRLLAVALFAVACEAGSGCTTEAVGSVNVTVTAEGADVSGAAVTYTVDGGEVADCEPMGMDAMWVCGWEIEGTFEVTVQLDGFPIATETVTVESDTCHVIGESLTIALARVGS